MIERRITFIIGDEGIPVWKLSKLKMLASYFRSVVVMLNVTQLNQANVEQTIRMMSLGCNPGDLCQLFIAGSDAELACMVFTDFLAEQFMLVNTTGNKHRRNTCCIDSNDASNNTFYLPFKLDFTSRIFPESQYENADKPALLGQLCEMISAEKSAQLLQLMLKREAVSSTLMGNGIALPHVITAEIDKPAIAMILTTQPIIWRSNRDSATRLIAMILPAPVHRQHIQACAHFSRSLLEPAFCQLLTANKEPEALKAIILHSLSRPFHPD